MQNVVVVVEEKNVGENGLLLLDSLGLFLEVDAELVADGEHDDGHRHLRYVEPLVHQELDAGALGQNALAQIVERARRARVHVAVRPHLHVVPLHRLQKIRKRLLHRRLHARCETHTQKKNRKKTKTLNMSTMLGTRSPSR